MFTGLAVLVVSCSNSGMVSQDTSADQTAKRDTANTKMAPLQVKTKTLPAATE